MKRIYVFLFCLAGAVSARELYVAADAVEGGDGSLAAALDLRTAIEGLEPGDTLTLLPGEYQAGELEIKARGTAERPIVIQGADRDLAVLTAWAEQSLEWSPAPGKRFVYASECELPVVWVTDVSNGMILQPAPDISDMDRFRGTWIYDAETKTLYVHALDGREPPAGGIKTTVSSGNLLRATGAEHVTIRNISFYGSAHADPRYSAHGSAIHLLGSKFINVEDCSFQYNSGGVNIVSRSENVAVRRCYFLRNESFGYSELAQVYFSGSSKHCLAEDNVILHGRTHGLRFYGRASDVAAFRNTVIGERIGLYFKASVAPRAAESNVVLRCSVSNFSDEYGRPTVSRFNTAETPSSFESIGPNNLLLVRGSDEPRFCAPEFHDYRLQADSPFLGRGTYPDISPVYYVARDGDDQSDGRSERSAFRSLERALREARAGATIYLEAGTSAGDITLPEGVRDLTLRGRGPDPDGVIESLRIVGGAGIRVENLKIGSLRIENGSDILVERVLVDKLMVDGSRRIRLRRGNVAETVWRGVSDSVIVLSVLPDGFKAENCEGLLTGYNATEPVTTLGGQGEITGAFGRRASAPAPRITDVALIGAYPNGAAFSWTVPNINFDQVRRRDSWWTTRPIVSFLDYGETEDCKKSVPSIGEIFHHARISGLKPGTRYYYRVRVPETVMGYSPRGIVGPYDVLRESLWAGGAVSESGSFVTPAEYSSEEREIYVSARAGRDGDGTRGAPLRRIAAAVGVAEPGDTIILLPGVYRESLEPRVSGLPGSPITIRADETGTAILDGSNFLRPGAAHIQNCSHIIVQGLVFRNFSNKLYASRAGMEYGQMQLVDARHIELRDNVFSGYGVYQYLISVKNSSDIVISNNVFADGVNSISGAYNGNLTIEGNTFYAPLIYHFYLNDSVAGSVYTVRGNLFLYQNPDKAIHGVSLCNISGDGAIDFDGNAWLFSREDPVRFCGMEGGRPDPLELCGVRRLRERTPHGGNDVELEALSFKNPGVIDPWDKVAYRRKVVEAAIKGELTPTLEFFEVADDGGYGASPSRAGSGRTRTKGR